MSTKYKHLNESKKKYHMFMMEPKDFQEEFFHLAKLSIYLLKDLYILNCAPDKIERYKQAIRFMISNNRRIIDAMEDQKNVKKISQFLDEMELYF
jgi:hypothetical protein